MSHDLASDLKTNIPVQPYLRVLHEDCVALRIDHRNKGMARSASIAKVSVAENAATLIRPISIEGGTLGVKGGTI
jgi:hypothetical protein